MHVVTDMDVSLNFGVDAPRLFEMHVKQAVRRMNERYVAAALRSPDHALGHRADLHTPTCILRSKSSKGVLEADKALLRVVVGDGIWTNRRRFDAGLWDTPKCAMCGEADDTLFHRVWECTNAQVMAARSECAAPTLCKAALRAGQGNGLHCHASS